MPQLKINGQSVTVEDGSTVMQACELAGFEIPHFCYHRKLNIAGNCRMCLVELEKSSKPIASCAMPAADGMVIFTNTPSVKRAREGVMEFLLINHPLDCPICDQGGECDLQDQARGYGRGRSRYRDEKRAVDEKNMGPLVKTAMTRCIHCTRCVRFATEIAGVQDLGAINRGEHMEITTYLEKTIDSELSGNIIDLCPVGALTSKPYAFSARPWELSKTDSIDVMDSLGSNIRVDSRGNEVKRILPRLHDDINEEWISDKARFSYDGLLFKRLDRPWVRKAGKLRESSWHEAFKTIAKILRAVKGSEIAGLVGDLNELESMKALKDLFTSIGSKNIECRQDQSKLDTSARAGYLFNSRIAGVSEADVVLLIGSNPRTEAAVLNARIGQRVRKNQTRVYRLGLPSDLTFPAEELGSDPRLLDHILSGKHALSTELKNAKRAILILGMGALARSDGPVIHYKARAIAETFGLIRNDWNGFNVLHTTAARVGALALGLTYDGGIERLGELASRGKIKVLFNLGADEADLSSFSRAFKIYIGSHGDKGAMHSDVILPAAAYTEKNGTFINTEGRIQKSVRAVFPPGDAREDWTIFRALSEVMGKNLPYDDLQELRAALAQEIPETKSTHTFLSAPWSMFGAQGVIEQNPLGDAFLSFYTANPILRSSGIMAECKRSRLDQRERTGTDG